MSTSGKFTENFTKPNLTFNKNQQRTRQGREEKHTTLEAGKKNRSISGEY